MNTLSKNCQQCNKSFNKPINCSLKDWNNTTRFCSKECFNLYRKGKTSPSPATCFKKGKTSWNKGNKGYKSGKANHFWKGGQVAKKCKFCKSKFKVYPYRNKQKYCSRVCSGKAKRGKRNSKATEFKPKYGIKDLKALKLKIRNCNKYVKWRKSIFERDDYTCVLCHQKGVKLQADHYPKAFSEILEKIIRGCKEKYIFRNTMKCKEMWESNNGRTLCKLCHFKTDNYGGKSIKLNIN